MFHGAGPGRPKGLLNKSTVKQRELAEMILGKPGTPAFDEFVAKQRIAMLSGDMAPAILQTLLYYLAGKPTERIEVKDTTPDISDVTAEELRARALALASRIVTDSDTTDTDVTIN